MKYFYTGLALLAICLIACCWSVIVLGHYTETASQTLTQAMEQAESGDYEAAGQTVERTMEYWQQHHGFFGVILRHDEADEIGTAFRALVKYATEHSDEEFIPNCAELIARINHLSDMELPHYYNVLTHNAYPSIATPVR